LAHFSATVKKSPNKLLTEANERFWLPYSQQIQHATRFLNLFIVESGPTKTDGK
jgi:hypothetical protein